MVIIKVVALFDDRVALQRAMDELVRTNLAAREDMTTEEPDPSVEEAASNEGRSTWDRLKDLFEPGTEDDVSVYAEGLRRGSALLVVDTPNEAAEAVKDVLRRCGAVDLRRRVNRWITTGWQTFDPSAPSFTELEITDERRASISEAEIAADASSGDAPDRIVFLYDESTGKPLGRISEAEFRVLRDALQEERPDDDDYWINKAEIEGIAGHPDATAHLIALLRSAVGNREDGVDIRFEREGEPDDT